MRKESINGCTTITEKLTSSEIASTTELVVRHRVDAFRPVFKVTMVI